MSVALRGNLQDFGIADIFQLIGQQRKTGILEFKDGQESVQLRFDHAGSPETPAVAGLMRAPSLL